jgi:hypothetical protein
VSFDVRSATAETFDGDVSGHLTAIVHCDPAKDKNGPDHRGWWIRSRIGGRGCVRSRRITTPVGTTGVRAGRDAWDV